jgi:hypothetical protein
VWKPVRWPAPFGSQCSGLVSWDGGLVAVGGGDAGHLWTSSNGKKWNDQHIEGTASLYDVEVGSAGALVVGDAGTFPDTVPTLWASVDGAAWEAHPIAEAGSPYHLAVSPDGVLVVAGKLADGALVVWRSTDGLSWEEVALEGVSAGQTSIPTLESTPVGFVLSLVTRAEDGSSEGTAWVSADGSSWNRALVVPEGSLSAVGAIGPEARPARRTGAALTATPGVH